MKRAGRTAGRTCRAAESLFRARKSGRSRHSRLETELGGACHRAGTTRRTARLTGSEQKYADVVDAARVGQLKVGVRIVDLLQVRLDDATCDDTAEHGGAGPTNSDCLALDRHLVVVSALPALALCESSSILSVPAAHVDHHFNITDLAASLLSM